MKTKVICTIGPASQDASTLKKMIEAGMSVARLNFSHGRHSEKIKIIEKIKSISRKLGKTVKLLGDLQGPKIRIGSFLKQHGVFLREGQDFTITPEEVSGNSRIVSTDCKNLHKFVRKNDRIFLNDGKIELCITSVSGKYINCEVISGGILTSRKGLAVLNRIIPLQGVTEQDKKDLEFIAQNSIDWIAHSFVRKPEHILEVRRILKKNGMKKASIFAKIEDGQGFRNIDKILKVCEGIMVARGDLGVSVDSALVPLMQGRIIKKCNVRRKADIVATQILDSMIESPLPTRAEVNDVATAVMQGADYLMLSGETAVGKYPVRAVKEMLRIVSVIEKNKNLY